MSLCRITPAGLKDVEDTVFKVEDLKEERDIQRLLRPSVAPPANVRPHTSGSGAIHEIHSAQ